MTAYTLMLEATSDIDNPTSQQLADAVEAVRSGAEPWFAVIRLGEGSLIESFGADDPDGTREVEHRDVTGRYAKTVDAATLVDLVHQWCGLREGWDPRAGWELRPPTEEEGALAYTPPPADRQPILVDGDANAVSWRSPVYVDVSWTVLPDAASAPGIDDFRVYDTDVDAIGPDGQIVKARVVLRAVSRALIEELLSNPTWHLQDLPPEQEALLPTDELAPEAALPFYDVLSRVWQERVTIPSRAEVDRAAASVVEDSRFDPHRWERTEELIAEVMRGREPRLTPLVRERVEELIGERDLRAPRENAARNLAKRYVAGLSPGERDRHALLTWNEVAAGIAAAYPDVREEVRSEAPRTVTDMLWGSRQGVERRYATVARALLGTGMTRREIGGLLGIRTAKVTEVLASEPDDVAIKGGDPLRERVAGRVDLDKVGPQSEEEVEALRIERQQRRLAEHRAEEERRAQVDALEEDPSEIGDRLFAALDQQTVEAFMLSTVPERHARVAALLPDLPEGAINPVQYRILVRTRDLDSGEVHRRYGAAVLALKEKGASRAVAARHLGISPNGAKRAEAEAAQNRTLEPGDYLLEMIESWPNNR